MGSLKRLMRGFRISAPGQKKKQKEHDGPDGDRKPAVGDRKPAVEDRKPVYNFKITYLPQDSPIPAVQRKAKSAPRFEGMDSLVAAAYHNRDFSLVRLPDELLLDIMSYCDDAAIWCLRRTSRVFLRLFGAPEFKTDDPRYVKYWCAPWRVQQSDELLSSLRKQRDTCIYKDRYCEPCRDILKDKPGNPRFRELVDEEMFCVPCERNHSKGLFSATQRAQDPSKRMCIAFEGHTPICQHAVFKWCDIQDWILHPTQELPRKDRTTVDCSHSLPISGCIGTCTHSRETRGLWFSISKLESAYYIITGWGAHVNLPSCSEGSEPTAAEMREVLLGLQQDEARFFTLNTAKGTPLHMALFDPNFCSCLTYEGRERLGWQLVPPDEATEIRRTALPFGDRYCDDSRSRGLSLHSKRHYISLRDPSMPYDTGHVDFLTMAFRCTAQPGCGFEIRYQRSFSLEFDNMRKDSTGRCLPTRPWYWLVHWDSYGLQNDALSHNILWCLDEKCRNYVGSLTHDRFRDMTF